MRKDNKKKNHWENRSEMHLYLKIYILSSNLTFLWTCFLLEITLQCSEIPFYKTNVINQNKRENIQQKLYVLFFTNNFFPSLLCVRSRYRTKLTPLKHVSCSSVYFLSHCLYCLSASTVTFEHSNLLFTGGLPMEKKQKNEQNCIFLNHS